jgi:coenzyme F420-reducing hydrogenase beta subunit
MTPDGMGFNYPVIDFDKCIECDRCEHVCAFHARHANPPDPNFLIAYAARAKDPAELTASQSGAVSYLLMRRFIQSGGIVYGAGFVDHFRVAHKRAETVQELQEFRLSKYVQSDMGRTFRHVLADLKSGRDVLFTGTPCQTAGLDVYVESKFRERLCLQDLVCHGVPAPNVWRDYLSFREKKAGKTATRVMFRDPSCGWHVPRESVWFGTEKITAREYSDLYYRCLMLRPSCGICPYANLQRPSDLTFGDCWGIEKVDGKFASDEWGVSLILVNTRKGEDLLSGILPEMEAYQVDIQALLQPNLSSPTALSPESGRFERDFLHRGFQYVRRKYMLPSPKTRFRNLKWRIKKALKKYLSLFD